MRWRLWIGRLAVLALLSGSGALMAWSGLLWLVGSRGLDEYQEVEGQMTEFETKAYSTGNDGTTYAFRFTYDYTVAGVAYSSTTYSIEDRWTSIFTYTTKDLDEASRITGQFQVGSMVPVYHSSDDPSISLLTRQVPAIKMWVFLVLGPVLFVLGMYACTKVG